MAKTGGRKKGGLLAVALFLFDILALEAGPDLLAEILGGLSDVFRKNVHHSRAEAAGLHGRGLSRGNINNRNWLFLNVSVNFRLQFDTGDVRGLRVDDPVDDGDRDECVHLFRFLPLDATNPWRLGGSVWEDIDWESPSVE